MSDPALPAALQRHPRPAQWLRPAPDGTLLVLSGKVEIGQGVQAALAAIVADELGWPLTHVHVVHPATDTHPDEGVTSGSLSLQDSGTALALVAATLRARVCAAAAAAWGLPVGQVGEEGGSGAVDLVDGHVLGPDGRSGEALGWLRGELLEAPVREAPPRRPAAARRHIGRGDPRPGLRELFAGHPGEPWFLHDLTLPDLLHGRVAHPPAPGDRPLDDEAALAAALAVPGVLQAWRDGALFGVLADSAAAAEAAGRKLDAALRWQGPPLSGTDPATWGAAPDDPAQTRTVAAQGLDAMPPQPPSGGCRFEAVYTRPWIAHASIGPSAALARWSADGRTLEVWSHTQGPFGLRRDLALAFGLPESAVVVRHRPGAGCYGHNGADDVAFDAAWLAQRAEGRPVRLLWSRADDLARAAPLGPAMRIALQADVDAQGQVLAWQHELWSPGHSSRPGRSAAPAFLGNALRAGGEPLPEPIDMPLAAGGGAERNAIPGYALPAWRVVAHRVRAPWRSSALRSLGAFGNVFAAESFVDEIARASGCCPLAWRRERLAHDARALAVLDAAAARAGWSRPLDTGGACGAVSDGEALGRGIAQARYKGSGAWCAVVAEVAVADRLRVRRLTVAADVGTAVQPDGVAQQLEGGAIQATSWALKESVAATADGRVACAGWDDYPILGFSEVPEVDVVVLTSEERWLGAGEASLGPTAAAIANALADALGVRVRDLPLTPERIVQAMENPR